MVSVDEYDFGNAARKQQAKFRDTSSTISDQARSPLDDQCQRHGHLLGAGCEEESLYPSLRGKSGARQFFKERDIKWWTDKANYDDGDGPTRNMASSQVACVNFLLPLAEMPGALAAAFRAIDSDVKDIVDIRHKGKTSPVEFEWIGLERSLEGGTTRGFNNTSVDAFVIATRARDNGPTSWSGNILRITALAITEARETAAKNGDASTSHFTLLNHQHSTVWFPWTNCFTNLFISLCAFVS